LVLKNGLPFSGRESEFRYSISSGTLVAAISKKR
jgi:hypothetical protein